MKETPEYLDRITTQWSAIHDVEHFLVRYAPAVQHYLEALLGGKAEADDVFQEFLLRMVERGFGRANPERGRFRDYLKISVRNAALSHFRSQQRGPQVVEASLLQDTLASAAGPAADRAWLNDWRGCLLDRAWRTLEQHQQGAAGNLFHTVLRLTVDHGDEDSSTLAQRASAKAGRPLRADAFRQQLSSARRMFARLLVHEVAQTLESPTATEVEEELAAVGLSLYVIPFLPDNWRAGFIA